MAQAAKLSDIAVQLGEERPQVVPASFGGDMAWHVGMTLRYREKSVIAAAKADGIEAYTPMSRNMVRQGNSSKESLQPLFTGYVFLKFATEAPPNCRDRWVLHGFKELLVYQSTATGQPIPHRIPADFMEELQLREKLGEFDETQQPDAVEQTEHELQKRGLTVGSVARIDGESRFSGYFAEIRQAGPKRRVDIFLQGILSNMKATINVRHLWPAG